jgi:hypothetical protein
MDAFFILNILDHTCITCFVFANVLEILFQSLLQKGRHTTLQDKFTRTLEQTHKLSSSQTQYNTQTVE